MEIVNDHELVASIHILYDSAKKRCILREKFRDTRFREYDVSKYRREIFTSPKLLLEKFYPRILKDQCFCAIRTETAGGITKFLKTDIMYIQIKL